jgi:ectoine hydroxylase-related dioxygenase (phytanoyl-CoA dioxygenase family)
MIPNEAIPAIRLNSEEIQAVRLEDVTLQAAWKLFRVHGFLLLEDIFPAEQIDALRAAYVDRYSGYFFDTDHADALEVGDRRFMITVDIEDPFNDSNLFANPFILPIIKRLLGENCILGSFGSVAALPGAPDQHRHRDMSLLFDSPLESMLPSYAITLIIPLVDLGETNGTTRVWKGSHAVTPGGDNNLPSQDPKVPVGSCLMMDYRLLHAGTANCSALVRPILYLVYNRPWFRDSLNFQKQPALRVSRADYEKMDREHRALLAMAQVT